MPENLRFPMRSVVPRIIAYLLLGVGLNVAFAWAFVATQGRAKFDWKPYRNPRTGNPVAFFAIKRTGTEWVVGCGRPGSLIDRNPTVGTYPKSPWWPPEAVTFDDGACAVAAGWPLLSMSSWRTVSVSELPGDEGIHVARSQHWGIVLSDTAKGGWEEFPAVLPLRPLWTGFAGNALLYAATVAMTIENFAGARRRRRRSRGLCHKCSYPVGPTQRCPECGTAPAHH